MKILDRTQFEKANVFGTGVENTAYAQYFSGASFLNPLTDSTKTVFLANVTFEPGCRNSWHIHHASSGGGQLLVCTAGEGWYQEEGKPAVALTSGTVITIPANVKHWHGGKSGQLVFPYRRRGAGFGLRYRMVRAGFGRRIQQIKVR